MYYLNMTFFRHCFLTSTLGCCLRRHFISCKKTNSVTFFASMWSTCICFDTLTESGSNLWRSLSSHIYRSQFSAVPFHSWSFVSCSFVAVYNEFVISFRFRILITKGCLLLTNRGFLARYFLPIHSCFCFIVAVPRQWGVVGLRL